MDELNGLMFGGILIPEPVLEIIISKVPIVDFLQMNQVCRLWNEISKRIAFWKLHFESNNLKWSVVPEYIKQSDQFWVVMYVHCRKGLLTANFIKNHSGSMDFHHWYMIENGGHRMSVESPPCGCDNLPEDPRFPNSNVCFVTSFGWSRKIQDIELGRCGLTPIVMKVLLPFRIEIAERYTTRFDCGGLYALSVRLKNGNGTTIRYKRRRAELPPTTEWKSSNLSFDFPPDTDPNLIKNLKILSYKHGGRDSQFWAGHYGTKLARSSVRIVPLGDLTNVEYSSDKSSESDGSEERFIRALGVENHMVENHLQPSRRCYLQ